MPFVSRLYYFKNHSIVEKVASKHILSEYLVDSRTRLSENPKIRSKLLYLAINSTEGRKLFTSGEAILCHPMYGEMHQVLVVFATKFLGIDVLFTEKF